MRLLLVEDNIDFAKQVAREIGKIPNCELVWERSRDGALSKLRDHSFDLIIIDRKIPTADDVLDEHTDHGWAVFQVAREVSPGTPVWFLTGTVDGEFATEVLNEYSRSEDVHGTGVDQQMFQVFWKSGIAGCIGQIREFALRREELSRIVIRTKSGDRALHPLEGQVVRLFGRRHNCAAIDLVALSGGLSNSRVLKVTVRRSDGGLITTAVAKVSIIATISDEATRYRQDICRLTAGGFPVLAERVDVGAGDRGGLFYGIVGEGVQSLFDRLVVGTGEVAAIPDAIRAIELPWIQGKGSETVPVARVRRLFISDPELPSVLPHLDGIDITPIEKVQIVVAPCCQHGDAHCANVVFDGRGQPMLIDFGDTGPSFAAVDPVTMELSTIFHSQHTRLPAQWPSEAQLAQWGNAAQYSTGCSFRDFILACRAWADGVAGSPEEVFAVGYGYAMRQLKYDDTDKAKARALIRACIVRLAAPAS